MQVFKNIELQKAYDLYGYVKFSLLNADELNELRNLYEELKPSMEFHNGIHITVEFVSPAEKKEIQDKLDKIVSGALDRVFENYITFLDGYIIKAASSADSEIAVHQDWTFVPEEDGLNSGTLWMAVSEVCKENGGIGFVPGSHRWSDHFRYAPKETAYNPFDEHRELNFRHMKFEDLEAGEAILWNQKTLHASVPNTSGQDRVVVGMTLAPKSAQIRLHYQLPNETNRVGVFDVDTDFYLKYHSTALYNCFQKGEIPGDLEPVYTYEVDRARFDAQKLEAVLTRDDFSSVEKADILLNETVADEKDSQGGILAALKRLFSRSN